MAAPALPTNQADNSELALAVDTDGLNATFGDTPATVVIRHALALAQRPLVTSKFGPQSAPLLHLLVQHRPDIPVVWVDTGFNTRATLNFVERLSERLQLNLHVFAPRPAWRGVPPPLHTQEHAVFTRQVKLEPFARALQTLQPDVWFSSLRRAQTEHRRRLRRFERTASGLLKAAPLLDWRDADLDAYIAAHRLPVETDYCDPTKGESRRECGLHLAF